MPKDTPSMAKNKIRRSLVAIYDPHPSKSEVDQLWEYFGSSCSYCGVKLDRKLRTGHLDHLVPSSEGGSNNIHNHTLSCATCNGDEKREMSWDPFLAIKAESSTILKERKRKIEYWLSLAPRMVANHEFLAQSESIIKEALENFNNSVSNMRELRKKIT